MHTYPLSTSLLQRFASSTGPRIALTLLLSGLLAWLLNPLYVTPFPILLGRAIFVGLALLLAFNAAGRWKQRWLPRIAVQLLAVILMVPLATMIAYMLAAIGDVPALLKNPGFLPGFAIISASAWIVGIIVALGALYRERDARASAESLQFALEKSALERQALDSQLRLLQAQIEPHFLFNTLANVQALVESGSPQAATVLRHLISYLRAAMPRLGDAHANLGTELQLVRAYLELMRLRMPDRLNFHIDAMPELNLIRFPAMALLTLVENAVRHGIDPAIDGGSIEVGGKRDAIDGTITLWVADTGVGMSETAQPGTGMGNLRARLLGFYGPDARVDMVEQTPSGLRVELVFRLPDLAMESKQAEFANVANPTPKPLKPN